MKKKMIVLFGFLLLVINAYAHDNDDYLTLTGNANIVFGSTWQGEYVIITTNNNNTGNYTYIIHESAQRSFSVSAKNNRSGSTMSCSLLQNSPGLAPLFDRVFAKMKSQNSGNNGTLKIWFDANTGKCTGANA